MGNAKLSNDHSKHETTNCASIGHMSHVHVSAFDFGHWSVDNFVPIGIGTLTGLQSYMLNLFITPTYFY